MEGYLGKRGKRIGSRVKRYMRLDGPILSNHHTSDEQPTWRVDIKDASITCNPKRNRIVIELFKNKLELFAETTHQCEQWYEALTAAQTQAQTQQQIPSTESQKENKSSSSSAPELNNLRIVSLASDSLQTKDSNQRTHLGTNFKVIKPQPTLRSDSSSESEQLVVQGQVYEETPASMIFKQFNFPAK